jgi:hypothetical protein
MNEVALSAPSRSDMKSKIVTKRQVGKVTYLVEASSSDTATDTVECKIEKLILRGCNRI